MKKMSIIYLAFNHKQVINNFITGNTKVSIKIGETGHSDVRASQLKAKGETIGKYVEVVNNSAVRKYIESYIRLKIQTLTPEAISNGYDHFVIEQGTYKPIADNFEDWVYEALKGIQ